MLLNRSNKERVAKAVLGVRAERKQTLKYFQPAASRCFLRITVALPTMIPGLKGGLRLVAAQACCQVRRGVRCCEPRPPAAPRFPTI